MPPSEMAPVPQPAVGDAFGEALLARLDGLNDEIFYERDDGYLSSGRSQYFDPPKEWIDLDRWVLDNAQGRVLDIGAGAGRMALALQDRGQDVVALDVSPGAIEVCRGRGVRETFLGTAEDLAATEVAGFDSFVLLSNNIGILGSEAGAARLFGALTRLANPGATIIGTGRDWRIEKPPPVHADYHERNRQAGRMPGQIRLRTRFRDIATPWFDLLLVSPEEPDELARKSGWQVAEVRQGDLYGAILMRVE